MGDSCVAVGKHNKKRIEDSFKAFMYKHYSRGPGLVKVYAIENCITIYCKDILTSLEKKLFIEDEEGETMVKSFRGKIIVNNEAEFLNIVSDNIDVRVNSYYIDFNIEDNSLACVFILN